MKSLADNDVTEELVRRLENLTPETERRWGTMTPGEMVCHLGDASDGVLGRRVTPGGAPGKPLPAPIAWLILFGPLDFPKGVETRAGVNPKKEGTRPSDFMRDRERAIDGLRGMSLADPASFPPKHFRFGNMSAAKWQRWGYKHTDHHLRQFGL